MITLLYHDVTPAGAEDSSGFPGPEAGQYKLTPAQFRAHLSAIAGAVKMPPSIVSDAASFQRAGAGAWVISFDDGGLSSITEIAHALEERGWRGWFFITTDFVGRPGFCTREQLQDLRRRGHILGSHSCSHPERFSGCSREQILDEWVRSCAVLSGIIGEPVTTASVPGGFYSAVAAQTAAEAGISILFNSEPTTSLQQVQGCTVVGRYNIYRGMEPQAAVALIASPFRRFWQLAFWNAKKVGKNFAGPLYKQVRRFVLSRKARANA